MGKVVGILAGMGPEATVDLMQRIIRLKLLMRPMSLLKRLSVLSRKTDHPQADIPLECRAVYLCR